MGKFETSLETGIHAKLNELAGNYSGTSKVWFGPDNLADESPITGSFRSMLGGRFLLHEYKGSFQGAPLEGIQLIGYDLLTDRYQIAWVDSFHMSTGIMLSLGKAGMPDAAVLGNYSTGGETPQTWGWETSLQAADGTIVLTAYNISPEGERDKATEITYDTKFGK